MRHKYNAKKTLVDGITFDSKAEARRYMELKLMQQSRLISNLRLQPEFELQKKFKYDGKTERAITYRADFQYTDENGKEVVEDVKGVKTAVYKLKRKLFLCQFGRYFLFKETK